MINSSYTRQEPTLAVMCDNNDNVLHQDHVQEIQVRNFMYSIRFERGLSHHRKRLWLL